MPVYSIRYGIDSGTFNYGIVWLPVRSTAVR